MAILCIRIAPNDHPTDSVKDYGRTKPGDVVCIVNDGHQFSEGERKCGQYRFIAVPGVSDGELAHFVELGRESKAADAHPDDRGWFTHRRARGLNMAVLNSPQWRNRTEATQAELEAILIDRPHPPGHIVAEQKQRHADGLVRERILVEAMQRVVDNLMPVR